MKRQSKPIFGFTIKASQRVLVLQSEIQVTEVYDPASGLPAPIKKSYVGTWDTGATGSVISKRIVDDLGLKPSGRTTVQGVGDSNAAHTYEANTYLVNFHLPNNVTMAGVRACEGSVTDTDILVGMDVIGMGDFAVTHHEGKTTWTFRFPSCEEIDFVEEINEHNRRYGIWKPPLSEEERRKVKNKAKAEQKKSKRK